MSVGEMLDSSSSSWWNPSKWWCESSSCKWKNMRLILVPKASLQASHIMSHVYFLSFTWKKIQIHFSMDVPTWAPHHVHGYKHQCTHALRISQQSTISQRIRSFTRVRRAWADSCNHACTRSTTGQMFPQHQSQLVPAKIHVPVHNIYKVCIFHVCLKLWKMFSVFAVRF